MADLADMNLFVRAVATGSLSAAGRELGVSPAVASKRLARLEAALGVRLLQRSSRRLALTPEGALYLERCQAILADVAEAEAVVSGGQAEARGLLRVSAPVSLGRRWVGPAVAELVQRHAGLGVQLSLNDAMVDLLDGGFDCAVRIGGPSDSRLASRKLADNRRVVCAAPAYLERHGRPSTPDDLARHECLLFNASGAAQADWGFRAADGGGERMVRVQGRLATNTGMQVHEWGLAGLGLMRRSIWDVALELSQGQLVEVLADWVSDDYPIHVVFPSRRFLPVRTRLFIDAMVAAFDAGLASVGTASVR